MLQQLIAWMLGPSGMKILQWCVDHALLVNGSVVLLALLAILFPRQRARVLAALSSAWNRGPLAPSPEDREAIARAKESYQARKRSKKVGKP